MNRPLILSLSILLAFTAVAAGGTYQRTTDETAFVWNNRPAPDDEVSWDGAVDADGYATGLGTVTWSKNGEWSSKYSGPMVRGRLHGFVNNVDADGSAFAGTFARGIKQSDWHRLPPSSELTLRDPDRREPDASSSPQHTLAERQQEARAWLVTFVAARFIAHISEPADGFEVCVRELWKWGSDIGIDNSLATIFPDGSSSERAAIHGVLIALTEGKLSSSDIAGEITKEVFMDALQKREPDLATDIAIAERAWNILREAVKASNRSTSE
jgi:hypothetical protein